MYTKPYIRHDNGSGEKYISNIFVDEPTSTPRSNPNRPNQRTSTPIMKVRFPNSDGLFMHVDNTEANMQDGTMLDGTYDFEVELNTEQRDKLQTKMKNKLVNEIAKQPINDVSVDFNKAEYEEAKQDVGSSTYASFNEEDFVHTSVLVAKDQMRSRLQYNEHTSFDEAFAGFAKDIDDLTDGTLGLDSGTIDELASNGMSTMVPADDIVSYVLDTVHESDSTQNDKKSKLLPVATRLMGKHPDANKHVAGLMQRGC